MIRKLFKKNSCAHSWKLIDYHNYVDSSMTIEEYYTIGCSKCNHERFLDVVEYEKMRELNLI